MRASRSGSGQTGELAGAVLAYPREDKSKIPPRFMIYTVVITALRYYRTCSCRFPFNQTSGVLACEDCLPMGTDLIAHNKFVINKYSSASSSAESLRENYRSFKPGEHVYVSPKTQS